MSTKYDKVGTKRERDKENNYVWLAQLEHTSMLKRRERERETGKRETSRSAMNVRKRDTPNLCDDIASLSFSLSRTPIRCSIRRNLSAVRENECGHLFFFFCFEFTTYYCLYIDLRSL